jgi:hypothetical protein
MRCEVTGGFVEIRFTHKMTAEDLGDLIAYLDVWRRHRLKSEFACAESVVNSKDGV